MNPEKPYLLIVFGLLLYLGMSNLMSHRLQHDFPYGYLASDAFQQQTRAEGIADAGNYRHEPFYIVKGYNDVIGYYPPLLHHLGVILHFMTGIPVYDTLYFMVFFSAILAAFVMYVLIRRYNKHVAVLSLPLSILIFSDKPYIGFLWGHWSSIAGQLFLICIFWAMSRFDMEKSELLLGIFITGMALAHTSELLYGVIFVFIYMALMLFYKKFSMQLVKKIFIAGIIPGLLSVYTLFIFVNSFMVINPYNFEVSTDWGGTPIFYITDFQLLLLFLIAGTAISIALFRKFDVIVLAGLYMLGIGYTNYIGFGIRAFQPRFLWPIYFSFFFGIVFYMLIKLMPQKLRSVSAFALAALFLLVLSNFIPVPFTPTYRKVESSGLMDKMHWDAFQWLSKSTPQQARLYFFYGDVYKQNSMLRNSKRAHARVVEEDFVAALQNRTIERAYWTEAPADHGAGMPYFKSFFSIGLHSRDHDPNELFWQRNMDMCLFDYFIFDKASRIPVLAQYNLLIANELVKNSTVVFQNDAVVVLKNSKVKGDCIEKRNF